MSIAPNAKCPRVLVLALWEVKYVCICVYVYGHVNHGKCRWSSRSLLSCGSFLFIHSFIQSLLRVQRAPCSCTRTFDDERHAARVAGDRVAGGARVVAGVRPTHAVDDQSTRSTDLIDCHANLVLYSYILYTRFHQ